MATQVESANGNAFISSLQSARPKADVSNDPQNRFLTLLVTQMKSQDPLNPLDNAEVTSQLAQISTVSGIDKLNTTLQSLSSMFSANQSLQAAGMVGRGVLAPGSRIDLAEGAALAGVDLAEPADRVTVTVFNASGKAVHTVNLGAAEAGSLPFVWDGKDDAGNPLADGRYSFSVEAVRGGTKVAAQGLSYGSVASVSLAASGIKLNVSGLGTVEMSRVRQIM